MWKENHNPFGENVLLPRSILTGLTTIEGNGINCDEAEKVSQPFQDQLDGISFAEAKVKKKDQMKTLGVLKMVVEVDTEKVHVDPLLLFSMLLVPIERGRGDAQLFSIRTYSFSHITPS